MRNEKKATAMDADAFFWESNKKGNTDWQTYDIDKHLESLTNLLSKCSKEQLVQFETSLYENLNKLYTAEIAELNIILECPFTIVNQEVVFDAYLSTDGFIYFRCWLLLKGKEFFDEITTDINAFINGKYSFNIGDCWAEGLLYVASDAYAVSQKNQTEAEIQNAFNRLFPDVDYDSAERKMKGKPASGSHLQEKYPELVKEIVLLRST